MGKDKYNIFDGKGSNGWTFAKAIETDPLRKFAIAVTEIKAGFKPGQRRDKNGRWGDGSSYSKIDTKEMHKAHLNSYNEEEKDWGSTFNPLTGENLAGKPFFSVGLLPELQKNFQDPGQLKEFQIKDFLKKYKDDFKSGKFVIGTWYSESSGLYIDVIELYDNYKDAVEAGNRNNQEGIYDLKNKKFIPTGGTGKEKAAPKAADSKNILPGWGDFFRSMKGIKKNEA